MSGKAFIPVQARVTRQNSPRLFQHLEDARERGESPNSTIRQLAEEALLLREHPILKTAIIELSKLLSNQQLGGTSFLTDTPTGVEQKTSVLHTEGGEIKSDTAPPDEGGNTRGSRAMMRNLLDAGKV